MSISRILNENAKVNWKSLRDVAEYSKKRISSDGLNETNYVGVDNMLQDRKGKTISTRVPSSGNYTQYEPNDILIGNIRPYLKKIWLSDCKGGTNGDVLVIHPTDTNIDTRYLYQLLADDKFFEFNMIHAKGAKMPRGDKQRIMDYLIPIPPLVIQKEIVKILDSFSELTASLTTELVTEFTDRKKQYTYYLDKLLFFETAEVEQKTLGEIGEFQRGKRFVKNDMTSEGVPCIHYGEMYTHYGTWTGEAKSFLSKELVDSKNLRVAENDDVVIVAAGETIEDIGKGTAWLGDEGVVIHDACFSFRSSLNPKYVAYFTRTKQYHDQIRKHISSGKISAINSKGLSKVIIPTPPKEEQEHIVSILDKLDNLITSICESLPKEIELRRKQYEYYRDQLLTFPNDNIKA
ncbi:MAG: restriction endonuclease subunit S [Bacteroidota bacterium]